MSRPSVRIVALLAGVALLVSACGGGSSDESAGSVSSEGSAPATTAGSGSSGSADIEFGGEFDGSVKACSELSAAFASLALGPSMAFVGGEESLAELRAQLGGQTFRVPAELEDAFGVIDDAYAELEAALGGATINDAMTDPAAMQRIEEASAVYDTAEVQAALDQVGEFLEANCTDVDLGDLGN